MICKKLIGWFSCLVLVALGTGSANGEGSAAQEDGLLARGYHVEEVSTSQLRQKWQAIGKGRLGWNHEQLVMSEVEGSKGYMLISPETYGENVVVSYDVMVLRPASVLVTDLAANNGPDGELSFPEEYDSNVKYMFDNLSMYMMVGHNAAHNKPGPFIRRYPKPGNLPIVASNENIMQTGHYHHIEAGKEGSRLWYKIDGKTIVEVDDKDPIEKGKVILRIRGTAHEIASVLLRNVKIYSK